MNITKWNPFRELEDIQTRLNRVFDETPVRRTKDDGFFFSDWTPAVDVQETEKEYLIRAELPAEVEATTCRRSSRTAC